MQREIKTLVFNQRIDVPLFGRTCTAVAQGDERDSPDPTIGAVRNVSDTRFRSVPPTMMSYSYSVEAASPVIVATC